MCDQFLIYINIWDQFEPSIWAEYTPHNLSAQFSIVNLIKVAVSSKPLPPIYSFILMEKHWPLYKPLQASLTTEPDLLRSAFKWRWQTASSGRQPGLFITPTSWRHLPDETGRENVPPEKKDGVSGEAWTSTIVVTGAVTCLARRLSGQRCQKSGRLPCFSFITSVFVPHRPRAAISPSKFRTWSQARSTPGRGTWLGERGI